MDKIHLSFYVFIVFLLTSCASSSLQPGILTIKKGYNNISDGYTTTSVRNKMGASNFVEHPQTIMGLDDYLRGLAGVNVTGTGIRANVTIRGINSFQPESLEPLFVMNGTALSGYFDAYSTINPNDIKRVTVLTDAASTGIYGVRGANGVIIITLKNAN
jgi:TonB-dependent starch-binding outer membrane protein SusC